MIWTLARLTLRECFRRPFPYVVAASLILVVVASRLFLAFTFGRERAEALNLAISAAFLAGFVINAFLGTGLIRRDIERKTLAWVLAKPVGPLEYILGRLLGLLAASLLVAAAVTLGSAPVLVGRGGLGYLDVVAAAARTIAPTLVMSAAALAVSAIASRVVAPVLMLALFLFGSLSTAGVVPEFALFSLDANASAPGPLALLYGLVFCSIFTVFAYIVLAIRLPANRQD
ncbi:MAG: ABC transporter permease subunit [Planctomycetota bacterium]|jgi:ABC-type transport system involved in multi-copper enzyme maturation permease subunit